MVKNAGNKKGDVPTFHNPKYRLFTTGSHWVEEEKKHVPLATIQCGACPNQDKIRITNQKGHLPPEMMIKKFRQRDWEVSTRRARDHRCPDCQRASTQPPKEVKPVMAAPLEVVTEEPRQPSRQDRRRIMEALDANYDKDHYIGDMTDNALAEKLGVPRAWVSEIREDFFGEEKNEAIDEAVRQIKELADRQEKLEEIVLKASENCDNIRSAITRIENLLGKAI